MSYEEKGRLAATRCLSMFENATVKPTKLESIELPTRVQVLVPKVRLDIPALVQSES